MTNVEKCNSIIDTIRDLCIDGVKKPTGMEFEVATNAALMNIMGSLASIADSLEAIAARGE